MQHLGQRAMHPDHAGAVGELTQQHGPIRGAEIIRSHQHLGLTGLRQQLQKARTSLAHIHRVDLPAQRWQILLQQIEQGVDPSVALFFGQQQCAAWHGVSFSGHPGR